MTSIVHAFTAAMRAHGIEPPDVIEADGAIHRFKVNGERGKRSGAYRLHVDGRAAGWFQSWKAGAPILWRAKGGAVRMDRDEAKRFRREIAERKAQRDAAIENAHTAAAEAARERWRRAELADAAHPYLERKGVHPHGIRQSGDLLLVPMRDVDGVLHSLQTIDSKGTKLFARGGRTKGLYHVIGKPDGTVIVCEGYADGATLHEATGHAVAVAFTAGNLQAVAEAIRASRPADDLIIGADDDAWTEGNPGMRAATDAALAVGGRLAEPDFGRDRPKGATDFNDMHRLRGADAVRACIMAAKPVGEALAGGRAGSDRRTTVPDEWPDPVPLRNELLPVPQLDPHAMLPAPFAQWVADIAERSQCPPEFVAIGSLVAVGSTIGRQVAIRPKQRDDWHEFANLWGLAVGAAGLLKSPAIGAALAPLQRLETQARERHEAALAEYRVEIEAAKVQREAARARAKHAATKGRTFDPFELVGEDIEEPRARRFIVNDTTPEALGVILSANPQGVLAYRDELAGLLSSMEREGNEGARQFYLSAYSGKESYTTNRIGRGQTHIEACCLGMLGTIQPAVIASHIRDAVERGGGDGLLARFSLLVWPDLPAQWRDVDRWPDSEARSAVHAVFDRIKALDPIAIGASSDDDGTPPFVRFDERAHGLFVEWRSELEARLRRPAAEESQAFVSHLSKYRKLVPALALIFHVVEGVGGDVTERTLARALAWCDLLEAHARRAYGSQSVAKCAGARALLAKITAGALGSSGPFTLREVYRAQWTGLDTKDRAKRAVEMLCDLDYLLAVDVDTGGRPTVAYHVNPKTRA
ncbi:MAG: DUF3987 domain-containing protein [bacterium]|nr:DUF3987 domain-containing protein [Betaproteobacteria bacterium]